MLICYRIMGLGCFTTNAASHTVTVTTQCVNENKPRKYGRLRCEVMESIEVSVEGAAPVICVEA
jgi:hypothetical protein